jgi:hypothetical protein
MGWDGLYRDTEVSDYDFFKKEFGVSEDEIFECKNVGGVVYIACKTYRYSDIDIGSLTKSMNMNPSKTLGESLDLPEEQLITCFVVVNYWKDDEGGEGFFKGNSKDNEINFVYKAYHESELPFAFDCPEHILRILSPLEDDGSKQWRQECWRRINEKETSTNNENMTI